MSDDEGIPLYGLTDEEMPRFKIMIEKVLYAINEGSLNNHHMVMLLGYLIGKFVNNQDNEMDRQTAYSAVFQYAGNLMSILKRNSEN